MVKKLEEDYPNNWVIMTFDHDLGVRRREVDMSKSHDFSEAVILGLLPATQELQSQYMASRRVSLVLRDVLTNTANTLGFFPEFHYEITPRGASIKQLGNKYLPVSMVEKPLTGLPSGTLRVTDILESAPDNPSDPTQSLTATSEQIRFLYCLLQRHDFEIKIVYLANGLGKGYIAFRPDQAQ